MIVEGTYHFAASAERVWPLLLDPATIEKSMPGAQELRRVGGDGRYEGIVRLRFGPITAAEFELVVQLKDVREPTHYAMDIISSGKLGTTRGEATVDLVPRDGGATMVYRADLGVSGTIAGIGTGLLEQVSRVMTQQGLEALRAEVERRLREPGGAAPGGQPGHGPAD